MSEFACKNLGGEPTGVADLINEDGVWGTHRDPGSMVAALSLCWWGRQQRSRDGG